MKPTSDTNTDINLGWGEPYLLREVLISRGVLNYRGRQGPIVSEYVPNRYAKHPLEDKMRAVLKDLTGLSYDHVVLCAGATLGIVSSLRALSHEYGIDTVEYDALHYPNYPNIVKNSLLTVNDVPGVVSKITLTASPSNPLGEISKTSNKLTLWDMAYHSPTYMKNLNLFPQHKVSVGSFSKFLAVPGLRLGWVAFNDRDLCVHKLWRESRELALGYSVESADIVDSIMDYDKIRPSLELAGKMIDDNREEISKLEKFMSGERVPENGMFYFGRSDVLQKYMERCKITFTEGLSCGGSEDHMRISLGQTREITREAVSRVLKEDRRG